MRALSQLPDEQGVAAMQRINVTVLNTGFLGLFVGTALIAVIVVVGAVISWGTPRAALLLAAGLCYLVGSFGVTAAFNVPRNDRLARLAPASDEAARAWPVYVREWLRWNHVRTAASLIASAAAAASLAS
jgi:uncharacterized membrane protein